MSSRPRWSAALAGVLFATLLTGCIEEVNGAVTVQNDLDQPAQIWYEIDGVESLQGTVEVGDLMEFDFDLFDPGHKGDCTTKDIIARAADGTELARVPPPICRDKGATLSRFQP
jgi:hypothetical protein